MLGPTGSVWAEPPKGTVCRSNEEFKKAFEFLTQEEGLILSEAQAIREALLISAGCDHATVRFQKVYTLLKNSGVDLRQSFSIALKFAPKDDQMVENFGEIFKKIYLGNYLDLDFSTALEFSMALSNNYDGDPVRLREDFTSIVKFCADEKEVAVNIRTCSQVALELTKYSKFYPEGLFGSFQRVYRFLRTHKQMGIGVSEALKVSTRVLSKGSEAPDNFIKTIEYALVESRLHLTPRQALGLALAVADQSLPLRSVGADQLQRSKVVE